MSSFTPLKASGAIAFLETPEQIVSRKLTPFGMSVTAPLLTGHWFDGKPLNLTQLQSTTILMTDTAAAFSNVVVSISQALGEISSSDAYLLDAPELIVFKDLPLSLHEKIRNKLTKFADAHLATGFLELVLEEPVENQVLIANTLIGRAYLESDNHTFWVNTHEVSECVQELLTNITNTDYDFQKEVTETLSLLVKDIFITPASLEHAGVAPQAIIPALQKEYLSDLEESDTRTDVELVAEFYKRHTPVIRKTRTLLVRSYGVPGAPSLASYLSLSDGHTDYVVYTQGASFIRSRYHACKAYLKEILSCFKD